MKAFKGCTNDECIAYKKVHYKQSDYYCSKCGDSLSYVCADCWHPLEDNHTKYCNDCKKKRDEKARERKQKVADGGKAFVDGAVKVGVGAVAIAGALKDVGNAVENGAKAVNKIKKVVKK